jgi:preprotein translocase subunit SecA
MIGFLQKLFDNNDKEVAKYSRKVAAINDLEPEMKKLSDEQLRAKTPEFKERIQVALAAELERLNMTWEEMDKEQRRATSDKVLDPLLSEAFAVVRETGRRVLSMRHFDVQLIGGMVTHDGRVAELKTGEGKTLMASLPLYLNALFGKGAHLVTPNDYLSKFGAVSMGPLYHFLGMSVGIIQGASADTGDSGGTFIFDPEYRDPDPRYDYARPCQRRAEAYQTDITYGTNNEYGFDYLRDNLARSVEDISQPELFFAIVDEADSILIDEARTPLIISGPVVMNTDLYVRYDRLVRDLVEDRDFTVDEKVRNAMFTEEGQERLERALGIRNLSDPENIQAMQHSSAALKAHYVYKKDIDYVVRHNDQKNADEVVIVDEFTGRLMFGRRWSDGLHQAVEAKEGVKIENESQTYATITFQNYFRLYSKLAGMTGTAKTEEEELRKVYGLDVVMVPTNKPMVRKDLADVIYKTQEAKLRGITAEIMMRYVNQQPVLVGTRNIEMSERVSGRLRFDRLEVLALATILRDKLDNAKGLDKEKYAEWGAITNRRVDDLTLAAMAPIAREFSLPANPRTPENIAILSKVLGIGDEQVVYLKEALEHGIPHNVLNAKYHEKEAHIISEAGRRGAVTIATNMAGRGVDIILGGTVAPAESDDGDEVAGEQSFRRGIRPEASGRMSSLLEQESEDTHKKRANEVRALGGLFILGTERHESRRIDNQLRGRSGRQGDPGMSRFFVSMEDELMRLFGDKSQHPLLGTWPEEQSIDAKLFSSLIERAQRKVESHNFDIRKTVLNYDDVMNTQREVIYGQRRKVLEGADLRTTMINYLDEVVQGELDVHVSPNVTAEEWNLDALYHALDQTFPLSQYVDGPERLKGKPRPELSEFLGHIAVTAYDDKEKSVSSELMRDIERHWTMNVLDRHWMEHLSNMDYLREGISWRGYAQVDPLTLYKKEAFDMFQLMLGSLQDEVIRLIFNTQVQFQPIEPEAPALDVQVPMHPLLTEHGASGSGDGSGRAGAAVASRSAAAAAAAPAVRRVGRNDPCPCGSGKKYKVCHGR